MKFVLTTVFLLGCVGLFGQELPVPKSELRILLVGHDPAKPYVNYEPTEAMVALHKERTGAYAKLLKQHFKSVRVVYANDYQVEMSQVADVTVFDAKPKPLPGEDRSGREEWEYQLLPFGFSRPALMIAEVAADIGSPIGSKLDWL